ncbi:MAG TPA: hypothetical protein DEP57_01470 [Selenomonas sp.]|nr:hypothetical protein [Selenomonas sp.]
MDNERSNASFRLLSAFCHMKKPNSDIAAIQIISRATTRFMMEEFDEVAFFCKFITSKKI